MQILQRLLVNRRFLRRAFAHKDARRSLPDFEAAHLKGNCEDMMLRFLDDAAAGRVTCLVLKETARRFIAT